MPESIRRPIIKPYDRDRFEVVETYVYGDVIIPVGFKTNGANIPRLFWSFIPPNKPEYLSAVIVHDYLCDVAGNTILDKRLIRKLKNKYGNNVDIFKVADDLLYEIMQKLGCSKSKCKIFYLSVRLYHKIRYGNRKKIKREV